MSAASAAWVGRPGLRFQRGERDFRAALSAMGYARTPSGLGREPFVVSVNVLRGHGKQAWIVESERPSVFDQLALHADGPLVLVGLDGALIVVGTCGELNLAN